MTKPCPEGYMLVGGNCRSIENELTRLFNRLCDACGGGMDGWKRADRLYDSAGLNSDWPKTVADVEIARAMLKNVGAEEC